MQGLCIVHANERWFAPWSAGNREENTAPWMTITISPE